MIQFLYKVDGRRRDRQEARYKPGWEGRRGGPGRSYKPFLYKSRKGGGCTGRAIKAGDSRRYTVFIQKSMAGLDRSGYKPFAGVTVFK